MRKILVIDNDAEVLQLMKSRLEAKSQYEVMIAEDGEDGWEKAQTHRPHLIIFDIKMPKLDGYSFIRQLKRDENLKKIPAIVLTAYPHMQDLFALEGVRDYLVKPFDADQLLEKIERHAL